MGEEDEAWSVNMITTTFAESETRVAGIATALSQLQMIRLTTAAC